MTYLLALFGSILSLVGLLTVDQLSILCGTIYLCSACIIAAIQGRGR